MAQKQSAAMLTAMALAAWQAVAQTPADAPGGAFDCVVEPAQVLDLASPVAGVIEEVLVERGDRVSAGQVVARLRSGTVSAQLALARERADSEAAIAARQSEFDLAREEADRTAGLVERGIASQAQQAEALTALESARAALRLAELERRLAELEAARVEAELADLSVRSPIDGRVTARGPGPGELARADGSIVTVVQSDPLHIEAYLPIALWPDMRGRETVSVSFEQPEGVVREARIAVVDSSFDAASGTFGLRAVMDNPGEAVPGGQRCTLAFPAG